MAMFTKEIFEKTKDMVSSIIQQDVKEDRFNYKPPVDDELTDSNTIHNGKITVLFVDMRGSTEFTDSTERDYIIKTYRSYLKVVTYAIRANDGFVRDFTGDGILAVFCDDERDDPSLSEEKAINAARLVNTLVNYCLNPLLSKELNGISISCGIGICSGEVSITKVGMRGRESDDTTENETGIIWIGSCTNHASKLCGLAKPNEIVTDKETVEKLELEEFALENRSDGKKIYACCILKNGMTKVDSIITDSPVIAKISTEENDVVGICNQKLDEIQQMSITLGERKREIDLKEISLNQKESLLNKKENTLNSFEKSLMKNNTLKNRELYYRYIDVLSEAFLKKDYIRNMGGSFWEDIIEKIYEFGKECAINESETDARVCYYITDIYIALEKWDKAYDGLCLMAEYNSWMSIPNIEMVILNTHYYSSLVRKLEDRIKKPLEHNVYIQMNKALKRIKELKNL